MAYKLKVISSTSIFLILVIFVTPSIVFWNGLRNRFNPRLRIPTPPPTRKPTPAQTNPPAFAPTQESKYCDESNLQKILLGTGRKKRESVSWPYECTYAGIVKYKGAYLYMHDIYTCCENCRFPTYTSCVTARKRNNEWECPSDGLRCVFECVKTYGPGMKLVKVRERSFTSSVGWRRKKLPKFIQVPKKLICDEKVETRPDGKSTCIRRLCIKLKL